MTLLDRLQSNNFAVWLAIVACVILCPNMFYVFYHIGAEMPIPYLREGYALASALLLCFMIVYFICQKDKEMSSIFAYFEWFISSCYYTIRLVIEPLSEDKPINWYIIPALALSYILPWAVKRISSTISFEELNVRGQSPTVDILIRDNETLKEVVADREINVQILEASIKDYQAENGMLWDKQREIADKLKESDKEITTLKELLMRTQPPDRGVSALIPNHNEQLQKTEEILNIEKVPAEKPVSRVQQTVKESSAFWNDTHPESQIP